MTIELRHGVPNVVRAGLKKGRKSGVVRRLSKADRSTQVLIAIGVGLAVGTGLALAARERGRRRRPLARLERVARRGLKEANRLGGRGAEWASRRGHAVRNGSVPVGELKESVSEYLEAARQTIDEAVAGELRDLRTAMRRRRKRLGI
ncbi:MAG TPA: hypothetical protein VIC55_07735 [Gemmatimonadaceae bacterium]